MGSGSSSATRKREGDFVGSAITALEARYLVFLVFTLTVRVADFARLIGTEEKDLAEPLVGIDPGRKGVVFEISSVTKPSHSGSKGVTSR